MNYNHGGLSRVYLVECFDCYQTWHVDPGTTNGTINGPTIRRCPYCGSTNTKRYDDA